MADLADLAACEAICAGVDGIVHLGGQAIEADWETVLQANIIGCYNLFEAARRQGVKRVVFATTNHVIGFYPRTTADRPHRPAAPGQPLRRQQGVRRGARARSTPTSTGSGVLNIRIGNFGDRPLDRRRLSIWLSPRDFLQLVRIGLEHPDLHYEVVYGASENDRTWWDNANAYRLGYRPEDESEPFARRDPGRRGRSPPTWWPSSSRAARSARPSSPAIRNGSTDGCSARAGASRG